MTNLTQVRHHQTANRINQALAATTRLAMKVIHRLVPQKRLKSVLHQPDRLVQLAPRRLIAIILTRLKPDRARRQVRQRQPRPAVHPSHQLHQQHQPLKHQANKGGITYAQYPGYDQPFIGVL